MGFSPDAFRLLMLGFPRLQPGSGWCWRQPSQTRPNSADPERPGPPSSWATFGTITDKQEPSAHARRSEPWDLQRGSEAPICPTG